MATEARPSRTPKELPTLGNLSLEHGRGAGELTFDAASGDRGVAAVEAALAAAGG